MTSGKPNEEPEMGQLQGGGPHRRPYVSTTLLRGDLDTPPQISQVPTVSVADPDPNPDPYPYIFGHPGSRFGSITGSSTGPFYHFLKLVFCWRLEGQ